MIVIKVSVPFVKALGSFIKERYLKMSGTRIKIKSGTQSGNQEILAFANVADGLRRGREKQENILNYIVKWRGSTRHVMANYLGLVLRGDCSFWKKIDDSGLVCRNNPFLMLSYGKFGEK